MKMGPYTHWKVIQMVKNDVGKVSLYFEFLFPAKIYSRLTGFDALLIDRVVYYTFTAILRFLCTRKYLDASSLKHVIFMQK